MVLTIQERSEIVALMVNHNSVRDAANIFNERYPNRQPQLAYSTVHKIWVKFAATGSVHNLPRAGRPSKVNDENINNNVLNAINENPQIGSRALARNTNLCRNTIFKILHGNGFKSYKAQNHQALYEGDSERRFDFCNDMINWLNENPLLLQIILWSDECLFRYSAPFNRQRN